MRKQAAEATKNGHVENHMPVLCVAHNSHSNPRGEKRFSKIPNLPSTNQFHYIFPIGAQRYQQMHPKAANIANQNIRGQKSILLPAFLFFPPIPTCSETVFPFGRAKLLNHRERKLKSKRIISFEVQKSKLVALFSLQPSESTVPNDTVAMEHSHRQSHILNKTGFQSTNNEISPKRTAMR